MVAVIQQDFYYTQHVDLVQLVHLVEDIRDNAGSNITDHEVALVRLIVSEAI
jgi:hypothetical protein